MSFCGLKLSNNDLDILYVMVPVMCSFAVLPKITCTLKKKKTNPTTTNNNKKNSNKCVP